LNKFNLFTSVLCIYIYIYIVMLAIIIIVMYTSLSLLLGVTRVTREHVEVQ